MRLFPKNHDFQLTLTSPIGWAIASLPVIIGITANSNLFLQNYFWGKVILLFPISIIYIVLGFILRTSIYLFGFFTFLILRSIIDLAFLHSPMATVFIGIFGSNNGLITNLIFTGLIAYGSFARSKGINLVTFLTPFICVCFVNFAVAVHQYIIQGVNFNKSNLDVVGITGNLDFNADCIFMFLLILHFYRNYFLLPNFRYLAFFFEISSAIFIWKLQVSHVQFLMALFYMYRIFAITLNSKNYLQVWFTTAIGITIAMGFSAFGYGPAAVKLQQISVMIRGYLWRVAFLIWAHNPFIGSGFDSYSQEFVKYRDSSTVHALSASQVPLDPHNLTLNYLVSFGVVGSLMLICPIISRLKSNFPQHKSSIFWRVTLILLFGITQVSPTNIVFLSLFFMLLGYFVGQPNTNIFYHKSQVLWTLPLFLILFLGIATVSAPDYEIWRAQQLQVDPITLDGFVLRNSIYESILHSPFTQEAHFFFMIDDLVGLEKYTRAKVISEKAVQHFPTSGAIIEKYKEVNRL